MRSPILILIPILLAALLPVPGTLLPAEDARAEAEPWITPGNDGRLCYRVTGNGDRILDFSHAGYGGGGRGLPTVAVRRQVAPSGGEDAPAIQAAIDALAALPVSDGLRGAVLLGPGVFHCSQTIALSQDGIVLRGSGAHQEGTVIEMTGPPHVCVSIAGERLHYPKEPVDAGLPIADAYVPSGATSLSVEDAHGLAVGDAVLIRWLRTASWIRFMGMDALVRDGKPQTWMKNDAPIAFERTIRAMAGRRLTLDVPLTDAIDARHQAPGRALVIRTTPSRRLAHCALESLAIHSPPPSGLLTARNNLAAALDHCEDCWIRDIAMHDTLGNVEVGSGARRITITGVHALHTATVEKGAGYPADFLVKGSQVLIDRCSSAGSGSFYVATLNSEAVLDVVLNCTFAGSGSIQPHMHWSTGLLVDSCQLPDGRVEFIDRHTSGSGHGWAMGWAVAWNCTARTFDIQQPPGAVNWAIGCIGELKKGSAGRGPWLSSPGSPVAPRSLYLAQLRERLGAQALGDIGY